MSEQAATILESAMNGAISAMNTQIPAVDTQTKEVKPEVKEDPKISSKLQVLMQREKAAFEAERRSKQSISDAEIRLKGISEREAKIQEFESLKTTNPLKALELLGLTYQDITNIALADGNVTPDIQIKKVNDKLDNLLKSQEADRERQLRDHELAQKNKEQEAETSFKSEINTFIEDNKSKYQLTHFEGEVGLVYDVIDEHYNRTINEATGVGQVMKIAEAADKVESWLEKKNDDRLKLDKVKSKLAPLPGQLNASQFLVKQERIPVQKQMRTLTNQQSATQSQPRTKMLTDDERIAKAIAYARGLRP